MNKRTTAIFVMGVAEELYPLQFPFLFRGKGALIDRQSLSFISAWFHRDHFMESKFCTWMAATCAVASHSYAEGGLATKITAYKGAATFAQGNAITPDTAIVKHKITTQFY